MIAIVDISFIGIITNQHDDQLPVSLFTNNCKPVDKHFIIMQDIRAKIDDYLRVTLWSLRVGPGIERCRFEFWQRLSVVFCLGIGCKFLYFKDHRHDQMEIEEFKVNAELSQIRDSYV